MAKKKQITVLEFRCGTRDGFTAQDVLPPSKHPDTGHPYRWGGKGDWRSIPVIPPELMIVWQQELISRREKRKDRTPLLNGVEDTPRQRARVADALSHVSADCSYELYRDMVWAILWLGWSDAEDIAERWCQSAPHRYEEASFDAVIASYDEARSPTIGTIIHHARMGGWDG
jgi:putative DNA primase/helicase